MTAVLVVDDSALMRKHMSTLLKSAGMEVRTAGNGEEAVREVLTNPPDVVTLDVNMPEMDGLTALSQIMAAQPVPVVMVSSLTTKGAMATLEALAMGAVDYLAKPGGTISLSMDEVAAELVSKIKSAARARPKGRLGRSSMREPLRLPDVSAARKPEPKKSLPMPLRHGSRPDGVVIIGISTGGPKTLEEVLPSLPGGLHWPVVVAQHMPAAFTGPLARRLSQFCALNVREAEQFGQLTAGTITIAKGGTDLAIGDRNGKLVTINKPESPRHNWHPSVDVLVQSAMDLFQPDRIVAVQMTGMGNDGADRMTELKRRGGRTIAESEETCVVFGMPRELIARGGATKVLPASAVASQIIDWVR
jgi:two-component system chemotaxis response regulator CheB